MLQVGIFSEQQLVNKEDKLAIENAKRQNPEHKYIGSKFIKKKGVRYLKVWLMTLDEYVKYPGF